MVTRTYLNITLQVHYLSFYSFNLV